MDAFMLLIIACIVCCILAALVAVSYFVLTKPPPAQAPLLSDAQVKALMSKYNDATSLPIPYSNVLDYSLGHTGHVITPGVPPGSLSIQGCNNYCNGTNGCHGFQYNASTQSCELLSNVSNTFFTYDQGWNLFVTGTMPNNALGQQISNQGFSADPSQKKGPIVGATTYDACVPYCFSNASSCSGFSVSGSGCTLFSDISVQVPDTTSNSWKVVPITFGHGLSPAPSPT